MHEIGPLKREHSASLLLHLSPRDSGLTFADVGAPKDTTFPEAIELLEALPLMDAVDGHPGTLVRDEATVVCKCLHRHVYFSIISSL